MVRCCGFGMVVGEVVEMLAEIGSLAVRPWTERRLDAVRGALRRGCGALGRRLCGWESLRGCRSVGDQAVR